VRDVHACHTLSGEMSTAFERLRSSANVNPVLQ
jgi:hypothetical protein